VKNSQSVDLCFSPDSKKMACTFGVMSDRPVSYQRRGGESSSKASFIVCSTNNPSIKHSVVGGSLSILKNHPICWSPKGSFLAYCPTFKSIHIIEGSSHETIRIITHETTSRGRTTNPSFVINKLSLSEDGDILMVFQSHLVQVFNKTELIQTLNIGQELVSFTKFQVKDSEETLLFLNLAQLSSNNRLRKTIWKETSAKLHQYIVSSLSLSGQLITYELIQTTVSNHPFTLKPLWNISDGQTVINQAILPQEFDFSHVPNRELALKRSALIDFVNSVGCKLCQPHENIPEFDLEAKDLDQSELENWLNLIADANEEGVDLLLRTNENYSRLGVERFHSEKISFETITGFQYSVWLLDWRLWETIENFLDDEEAFSQLQEIHETNCWENGIYCQDLCEDLIQAYQEFLQNLDQLEYFQRLNQAQKSLPHHFLQEMNFSDKPFSSSRHFQEPVLPRLLSDEIFQSLENGHLLVRGTKPTIQVCSSLNEIERNDVQNDLEAFQSLIEVRKKQFEILLFQFGFRENLPDPLPEVKYTLEEKRIVESRRVPNRSMSSRSSSGRWVRGPSVPTRGSPGALSTQRTPVQVRGAQVQRTPLQVRGAQVQRAPVQVRGPSAQRTSMQRTTAQRTPVQRTQAQRTPSQAAQEQKTPVPVVGTQAQITPVRTGVTQAQITPVPVVGTQAQITPVPVVGTQAQITPGQVGGPQQQRRPVQTGQQQRTPVQRAQPQRTVGSRPR